MYQVSIRARVLKLIQALDEALRVRVMERIGALASDPRPPGAKKLHGDAGKDRWRIRVGDYRVIYTIEDDILLVTVVHFAHRRESYR